MRRDGTFVSRANWRRVGDCCNNALRWMFVSIIGTSVTDVSPSSPAPVSKPVAPVVAQPRTNAPAPAVKSASANSTNGAAPNPQAPEPPPIHGWVGIDRWARANGGRVRIAATGAQPRLELIAPAGRLEFSAGSQFAKWNGESFLLGFAPQISANEIASTASTFPKALFRSSNRDAQLCTEEPS